MPSDDVYANIVELYDLEHDGYVDDIELMLELASSNEAAILELGCGTGRILLPLAEAGHQVIGLDASQRMLDAAQQRIERHLPELPPRLVRGDMTAIDTVSGGPFGTIIASLNSIMHLTTQDTQRQMIISAHSALLSDGCLIIDTLNPSHDQLSHLLNKIHREGSWVLENGTIVDKWGQRLAGDEPQVLDTLIWYDHIQDNGAFRRVRTRFDLRYVYQSELALLLELAGFEAVDWYGNYDLEDWHPESDRIIAVAHKGTE